MTLLGLRSSKAPGREFRQHDGVVTILMCYRRRASPKRCDNMTEVEYGGGGHRTRLRNDLKDQLVCLWGAPWPRLGAARMWSPTRTPSPSRSPLRGEEGRRKWRS